MYISRNKRIVYSNIQSLSSLFKETQQRLLDRNTVLSLSMKTRRLACPPDITYTVIIIRVEYEKLSGQKSLVPCTCFKVSSQHKSICELTPSLIRIPTYIRRDRAHYLIRSVQQPFPIQMIRRGGGGGKGPVRIIECVFLRLLAFSMVM